MAEFDQLYPFESNYLELDGLRLHYLDEGPRDAPVIVMLHGNPTWSFYYRNLVCELRSRFRVIVPDHMGCGFSDKPQGYDYRLRNHVANFARLMQHLNIERFQLAVHDWGGPIGLSYAVFHPGSVERMLIFNTTCALTTDYPLRILVCRVPIIGPFLIQRCGYFAAAAAHWGSCNKAKLTRDVRAGYLKPYDSPENRIANLKFVQDIPLTRFHPSWEYAVDVDARLDTLKDLPMHICWGDRDFCFTPMFLEEWKRRFPHAFVRRFRNAGHYVVEDAIDDILPIARDFFQD